MMNAALFCTFQGFADIEHYIEIEDILKQVVMALAWLSDVRNCFVFCGLSLAGP